MSVARRLLLWECAFLSGVALVQLFGAWAFFTVGIVLLWRIFRRQWHIVLLCLLFLSGALRFCIADQTGVFISAESVPKTFDVFVQDVDHRVQEQRLTVRTTQSGTTSVPADLHRMLLSTGLYPDHAYGDVLRVQCKKLEVPGKDSYGAYLRLHGIDALCRLPTVQILQRNAGSSVLADILKIRELFVVRLQQLFPEPHAALAGGILLGAKQGIPNAVTVAFQRTGVSHILALSGYNITVVITAVFAVCLAIGVPRRKAFWLVLAGLLAFLLITGLSASVVRAAIMGTIVLLARHLGRRSTPLYALMFSASVMTLLNPFVLLDDVGFQLSFFATAGLFWIASWFERRLIRVPSTFGLREAFSSTLGATVATLPLMLARFGSISLVSPLTNVLVVPIVPLTMLLTAIGMALPVIGTLPAFFAWLSMSWILAVTQLLSSVPFAATTDVPLWVLLLFYVLAGMVLLVRWCSRQCQLLAS